MFSEQVTSRIYFQETQELKRASVVSITKYIHAVKLQFQRCACFKTSESKTWKFKCKRSIHLEVCL